jgi:molybdopterin-guanine dinucleotide biosynthesis protein A
LCALYRLSCVAAVEKRARSGDLSLHGLLHGVDAALVDRGLLAGIVDPNTCFLNVNTIADVARVERILSALTETEP